MICVNYAHLETLLDTLHSVSNEYELRINANKSAIFAVHGHNKITLSTNLHEIQITAEYTYLGVTIDHAGSIDPQLKNIQQRSKYLQAYLCTTSLLRKLNTAVASITQTIF